MNKILVVDDQESIQQLMKDILTEAGYIVKCTSSGEEALEMLKKEDFHVFFLDLQLPGMDGLELCRRIRKERIAECIYAITGYTSIYDFLECRKAGFDDYFVKPLNIHLIIKAADEGFEKIIRWTKDI